MLTRRTASAFAACIIVALLGVAPLRAAAASDSVTGLPLYPNAGSPDNTLDVPLCHAKGHVNTYDLLPGRDAGAVAWFAAHIHGVTHTRIMMMGKTQDLFVKQNGTAAAAVTGNTDGSLYGVSYVRFTPSLNAAQQATYGKGMVTC